MSKRKKKPADKSRHPRGGVITAAKNGLAGHYLPRATGPETGTSHTVALRSHHLHRLQSPKIKIYGSRDLAYSFMGKHFFGTIFLKERKEEKIVLHSVVEKPLHTGRHGGCLE